MKKSLMILVFLCCLLCGTQLLYAQDNNQPPIISSIPDVTIKEGECIDIPITVSDPDGDKNLSVYILDYFGSGLLLVDNGTVEAPTSFRICPTSGGRITITVKDSGGLTASVSFNVTVIKSPKVFLATFDVTGRQLFISGTGFGSSSAKVTINGQDVSSRIIGQSDTAITLKGSKKRLNLKKGPNEIVVIAGGVTSNSFILNF